MDGVEGAYIPFHDPLTPLLHFMNQPLTHFFIHPPIRPSPTYIHSLTRPPLLSLYVSLWEGADMHLIPRPLSTPHISSNTPSYISYTIHVSP